MYLALEVILVTVYFRPLTYLWFLNPLIQIQPLVVSFDSIIYLIELFQRPLVSQLVVISLLFIFKAVVNCFVVLVPHI